jgi:hypothetical protein
MEVLILKLHCFCSLMETGSMSGALRAGLLTSRMNIIMFISLCQYEKETTD